MTGDLDYLPRAEGDRFARELCDWTELWRVEAGIENFGRRWGYRAVRGGGGKAWREAYAAAECARALNATEVRLGPEPSRLGTGRYLTASSMMPMRRSTTCSLG